MSTNRPQWSILSDRGKGVLIGHAGPTADVITATVPVRADARLIVEAVNAYDTLRAENARLREALEEQTEAWQSIAHEIDVAGMSRRDLRDLAESLGDRARAALAR